MKDSYNRSIDYLRISITDRCNLKCLYCKPSSELKYFDNDEIMTDDEIVRLVRIGRKHGLSKVRITGGEPLLRKNIMQLISSIKAVGITDLSITTNGIMLPKLAKDLKTAGLDRINISLDTLKADRYRSITGGGDIEMVWNSIRMAEQAGLTPIKINIVPMAGINDDEIVTFASLTKENNFHIRFIEYMPATGKGGWNREKCISSKEVLKRISALGELEQLSFKGGGPSRNYRIKGASGVIGVISAITDHFCDSCNRLRLTANGRIRPCLFSEREIDIKSAMREGKTDHEIEELFCEAVRIKPAKHLINEDTDSSESIETMSKIGG